MNNEFIVDWAAEPRLFQLLIVHYSFFIIRKAARSADLKAQRPQSEATSEQRGLKAQRPKSNAPLHVPRFKVALVANTRKPKAYDKVYNSLGGKAV